MHDQIVFVEKSSNAVKSKRLKALTEELDILNEEMHGLTDSLTETIAKELADLEVAARMMKDCKDTKQPSPVSKARIKIAALTAVHLGLLSLLNSLLSINGQMKRLTHSFFT